MQWLQDYIDIRPNQIWLPPGFIYMAVSVKDQKTKIGEPIDEI